MVSVSKVFRQKAHARGDVFCAHCGLECFFGIGETKAEFWARHNINIGTPSRNQIMQGFKATSDHIIPTSRGGANSQKNMQILCFFCNSEKGSMLESEIFDG